MKAPLYVRVSSEAQAERWSLPGQIEDAKRQYVRDGIEWDDALVYWDDESGKRADRGGLTEWIDAALGGGYGAAYFHALDRLGRDLLNNLTIKRQFDDAGVRLVSVNQGVDYSTTGGKWIFAIESLRAETFLDDLKRHIRRGKRQRAAFGLSNAPYPPFGYSKERRVIGGREQTVFVPDKNAEAVKLAFTMYATGRYSYQDIADELNRRGYRTHVRKGKRESSGLISAQSVRWWLINRVYIGEVQYTTRESRVVQGKRRSVVTETGWVQGQHEAIIDHYLFERVQSVAPTRYNAGRSVHRSAAVFPFGRGLGECSVCGEALQAGKSNTKRYYRCAARIRGVACTAPQTRVRADMVEDSLLPLLERLKLRPDAIRGMLDEARAAAAPDDAEAQRARLAEARRRLRYAYINTGDMSDTEYSRADADLAAQIAALDRQSREADTASASLERVGALLEQAVILWRTGSLEDRRDMARQLFDGLRIDTATGRVIAALPARGLELLFDVAGAGVADQAGWIAV